MLKEFRDFALRGNVVDMAVGIIIGAAFGTIVKSLVDDVIMPPIGLLLGGVDFASFFVLLKAGAPAGPYASLADAQAIDDPTPVPTASSSSTAVVIPTGPNSASRANDGLRSSPTTLRTARARSTDVPLE